MGVILSPGLRIGRQYVLQGQKFRRPDPENLQIKIAEIVRFR